MPHPLPDLHAAAALPDVTWESLRARLDALNLDAEALTRFDFVGPDLGDAFRLPYQQWCAREEGTIAALGAGFLRLGEDVSRSELEQLLGTDLAASLRQAGLATELADGRFEFALKLGSLGDKWILADRDLTQPDAVMGASAATVRLFDAVVQRPPVASVLDLGCGGGALALALSSIASRVTGTDISQRALAIARINAAINGISSARFRHGDLLEPVAGERFERIVCQPPFIPTMGGGATYASGGALGDAITLRILRELHRALSPGGLALFCVEWARSEENEWLPRFRAALGESAMHVVHFDCFRTAAEDYCVMLAPYLHWLGAPDYGTFLKAMLSHYRRNGITTIDLLVHAMEPAPDGISREWVRRLSMESLPFISAATVDASFAALRLMEASDETLLEARLRSADGLAIFDGTVADAPIVWLLVDPRSLARTGYAEGVSARLALRFGEGRVAREVFTAGAEERQLDCLRELLRRGYVLPAANNSERA